MCRAEIFQKTCSVLHFQLAPEARHISQFSFIFRKLKRLSLKNNQLPSLPRKNLTLLRNLEELRLQDNRIQDITGIYSDF